MAPVGPKTKDSNADYLTAAFSFFKELCHHLQQRASFQQQGESLWMLSCQINIFQKVAAFQFEMRIDLFLKI